MSSTQAVSDADQWASFCDRVKSTGMEILASGAEADQVNRSEGLRYLARLLRGTDGPSTRRCPVFQEPLPLAILLFVRVIYPHNGLSVDRPGCLSNSLAQGDYWVYPKGS